MEAKIIIAILDLLPLAVLIWIIYLGFWTLY